MNSSPPFSSLQRRDFLTRSSLVIAAAAVDVFPSITSGKNLVEPLKLALVGCGGRGARADDRDEL